MAINYYNYIDIHIFSILLLLIIIIHTYRYNGDLSLSARYRTWLAFTILIISLLDILSRSDLPIGGNTLHKIKFAVNFAYLSIQSLPVSLGLLYLFSLFREKRFSLPSHLLFLLPFFAGCVLMVYSLFTDYVFYIDGANVYHRGPGMFIFAIINYSFILPALGLVIYYRDTIKKQTLLTVLIYTLIPCIGSLLQLLFYGIITAWPSFSIALLIIYLFLESRRSDRDYLTGLWNRQSFETRIYSRMEQYTRKGPFALVVIDLNKFKNINDTYGHDKGDEILQTAGTILDHSLSASDTLARYGGDEFVIILETEETQIVKKVLDRINRNIEDWNRTSNNPFTLSLSAGYEIFNPDIHRDYDELFQRADEMMFRNKKTR